MKQLIIFFGLACMISWVIWLPLYGHIFSLSHLPTLPYNHALGALGPMIASLITTWIFNKSLGVKQLVFSCLKVKPLKYLSIALFGPFILALIAAIMNYIINRAPIQLTGLFDFKEQPNLNILCFFVYNLVFFGFGEELGWRGFALPRIQYKFNALASSIIITVFWALWHWPLFFYRPGYSSMDIFGIVGWVFSLLTGSILLTWLYNSSRASILICAIFHSTIDMAFTSDFIDQNTTNYMGILITVWGILTIIIFKPVNLAFIKRIKNFSP